MQSAFMRFVLLTDALLLLAACARALPETPVAQATQPAVTTADTAANTAAATAPAASAEPPTPAPTATAAQTSPDTPTPAFDAATQAEVEQYLATVFAGQPFSGAVLVAKGGTVLLNQGYGMADRAQEIPNTPQTRFRLGSVTKPFTAIAILMLHDEGKLDIVAPVCQYLASCPPAWREITLAQILSHTAGIPDLTRFPDFEATKGEPSTPEQLLARFMDKPLDFPPGSRWQYSNSGYLVLGVVVERVAGQPYESFLQERIFTPLAMQSSGYDHNLDSLAVGYTPTGEQADFIDMSIPFAAGALYSTVEDLYRWHRALDADQLLPQPLRDAMFTIQAPLEPGEPNAGYGYGWIVRDLPNGKIVGHNGVIEGFSAGIRRYLGEDAVIIVLSNEQARHIDALIDGLEAIILRGTGAP